jgi:hypothetical protein
LDGGTQKLEIVCESIAVTTANALLELIGKIKIEVFFAWAATHIARLVSK